MGSVSTAPATLKAAHRERFRRFRVGEETASRFHVHSVSNEEARTVYGVGARAPYDQDMGGICFEYRNPETRQRTTARIRRDDPEVDEDGKPKNKYMHAWGDRPHLYLPPDTLERLADPETSVVLVEAENSVLTLSDWRDRMQQKILPIGLGGCWGAHGRIGKRTNSRGKQVDQYGWVDDLHYLNGRTVYVCLDANVSTNKLVKKAQAALVRELMRRDCKVLICTLPLLDGVNGPDDLVGLEGDEAMAEVFARAVAAKQSCDFADGRFEFNERGVSYIPNPDKDGNARPATWLCASLQIEAMTRDNRNGSWGRLLKWTDRDEQVHRMALPLDLLRRDGGTEALCLLESEGLVIGSGKNVKDYATCYIRIWPIDYRARCVDRPGWATTSSGIVYVLPNEAIGSAHEPIVFQSAHSVAPAYSSSGSVEEWQKNIAAFAPKNSRLTFAISTAFAGPLLELVGEQSGGFHIRGLSSIGKSTALELAASVWGNPQKYRRTWRTTVSGLEGQAVSANDGLLVLDELGQVEAKDAGEAAYMLANGVGKSRAARNGMARPVASWTLLFISAGEPSLAQHMKTAGRKPTAGQELRMAEIDGDAGANMGMLEELHGYETPPALIEALREATRKYYGAVGYEYLRLLVKHRASSTELAEWLGTNLRKTLADYTGSGAGGQVERVARRFALVAVAGELATKFKLTGWQEGEATKAAGVCLISWMNVFGDRGNKEDSQLLEQVRSFVEANGAARFENVAGDDGQRTINRCGFYRVVEPELNEHGKPVLDPSGNPVPKRGGLREYLVLPQAFRNELCAGFDFKFAVRVLKEHQWLIPGNDKTAQVIRVPGLGPTRVYVVGTKLWEDGQ